MAVSPAGLHVFVGHLKRVSANLRSTPDVKARARTFVRDLIVQMNAAESEGVGPHIGLAIHHLTPQELGTLVGEALRGAGLTPKEIIKFLRYVIDEYSMYCRVVPRCGIGKCSNQEDKCGRPVLKYLLWDKAKVSDPAVAQLREAQHTWQRSDFLAYIAAGSRALLDPSKEMVEDIPGYAVRVKDFLSEAIPKEQVGVEIISAVIVELTEGMTAEETALLAQQGIPESYFLDKSRLVDLVTSGKGYKEQSKDYYTLMRSLNPCDYRLPSNPIDVVALFSSFSKPPRRES